MIHTDYSELFIDLIANGLDMSKYNSVINNIIDNTFFDNQDGSFRPKRRKDPKDFVKRVKSWQIGYRAG